ncbi:MAG: hypothetical protein IKO40_01680 [Kiritimatiellae bacterium]|nr:hypothetical protein [Kiritimatiellia bacterium]
MAINLSNVRLTIDQFQRVSDGKFNAGEVRLASETSIEKVNNHVTFTLLNKKKISHNEVLAIKNAFVKALSDNHVGEAEIARVRQELGLAPTGASDKTLSQRSLKPLSRQQVREILDRNADTINGFAGEGTIRTARQLQAGLDPEERTNRANTRNNTNAGTDARRPLNENFRVTLFQDILAGKTRFRDADDQAMLRTMAINMKDGLLESTGGNPSPTKRCILACSTGEDASVDMDVGCTELEFVAKLDEILMRFGTIAPPGARALGVLEEFNALPDDNAKHNWPNSLRNDPDRGFKYRTVAVATLVDRGVCDYETLSAVNKISDSEARLLVETLFAIASNLKGDRLKNFQFMQLIRMQAKAVPAEVPGNMRAHIPALSPETVNGIVNGALGSGNAHQTGILPFGFKKMLGEIRADMTARFGADVVPPGINFSSMLYAVDIDTVTMAATREGRAVTPESIREVCAGSAKRHMATNFTENAFKEILAQAGGGPKFEMRLAQGLVRRHPDLLDTLYAAGSPEAARAALGQFAEEMRAMAVFAPTIAEFAENAVVGLVKDAFAKEAALAGIQYNLDIANFGRGANDIVKKLSQDIIEGKTSAKTPEDVRKLFKDEAAKLARERVAILRKAGSLGLSKNAAAVLKTHLLTLNKTRDIDLDAIKAASTDLAAQAAEIASLIASNASAERVFAKIGEIQRAAANRVARMLEGKGGEIGPDEKMAMAIPMAFFAFDAIEGFTDKLFAFFEREDVKNLDFMDANSPAFAAVDTYKAIADAKKL